MRGHAKTRIRMTGIAQRFQQRFIPVWGFDEHLGLAIVAGSFFQRTDAMLTLFRVSGEIAIESEALPIQSAGPSGQAGVRKALPAV